MKKNRALSRCYLGGYIFWIFGVTLAALMFLKLSIVLMTILIIVAVLILGALIASHVLYDKKQFKLFFYFSLAAFALSSLYVLAAFILEIVLQAKGEGALYAIVVLSISLAGYALVDIFLVRSNLKLLKNNFQEIVE